MEARDWMPPIGGTAIILLLTAAAQVLGLQASVSLLVVDAVSVAVILLGLYYMHETFQLWGGDIGRALGLVAIAISYYGILLHVIHLPYHTVGNPTLLFLPKSFFTGLAHVSSIWAFIVGAYGFYLFYGLMRGRGGEQ